MPAEVMEVLFAEITLRLSVSLKADSVACGGKGKVVGVCVLCP